MNIDELKQSAHWFLYMFAASDPKLGTAILSKRRNQIIAAQNLADSGNMDFNTLKMIIREGIIERYGMEPQAVLQRIYSVATNTAIGSAISDEATRKATENLKLITTIQGKKEERNIWSDITGIINSLGNLFQSIGLSKKTIEYNTPMMQDWQYVGQSSSSSITSYITIAAIAAIGLFFYMSPSESKSKKSKR